MNKVDLKSIDWDMFKKQKRALVQLADSLGKVTKIGMFVDMTNKLDGVINLMDYIQDCYDMEQPLFNKLYGKADGTGLPALKFVCPVCGDSKLEEVCNTDTVINEITRLDPEGDHDYGETRAGDDTEVDHYQCATCGHVLVDEDNQ